MAVKGLLLLFMPIEQPPADYQSDATATVTFAKPELVRELCGMRDISNLVGCQLDKVIVVPNPCAVDETYAQIVCHELGHLNGWPADHSDPR